MARRFPPPWTLEDFGHCWTVKDANGLCLVNVPYREDKWLTEGDPFLTKDEARRIAANVAKLTDLLRKTKD